MPGFISGIQMDADADQHCPKREMILSPDLQMLQTIIIEDTVVDPFTGSTLAVGFFIKVGIPGDTGMETQVGMVFDINSPAITALGTFLFIGAGINPAAFQRAAIFMGLFYWIVSPWTHFVPCPAQRMPLFIESNVIRCVFGGCCPSIDINEGIDIPMLQQFIGRDIVMGGVQTDVFRGEAKGMAPKIIHGIQEVQAVMAAGLGKLEHKGEFHFFMFISVRKHV